VTSFIDSDPFGYGFPAAEPPLPANVFDTTVLFDHPL
jgi:hypothetical protein